MYADDTTLHCCLEDIEDDNKEFKPGITTCARLVKSK